MRKEKSMRTEEISLSDLMPMLRRNTKRIVRWVIGVTIAGILVAYLYPPSYEASTKVIIQTSGEALSLSKKSSDLDMIRVTIEDQINTEMEIVRSRPVLEKVVTRLEEMQKASPKEQKSALQEATESVAKGFRTVLQTLELTAVATPFEAAVADLSENITLNPILDSSVIEIIVSADSPELAATFANLLTEEYMTWHIEVHKGKGASQFYDEQLTSSRAKLEKLEDELSEFKTQEGLVSIDETKRNLLDQLSVLNSSLNETEKTIISEESNLRALRTQMQDGTTLVPSLDIGETPWIEEALNKLMELELRMNELRQKYTTTHREIENLEGEIALTKDFIKTEVGKVIELKEVNLKSLRAERDALRRIIQNKQNEINTLPKKELTIERYDRAIAETKGVYESLNLKTQESTITESSDERVVNLRLINRAHPPLGPTFPNKILTIVVSPFLGLILGLTAALVSEFGSRKFAGKEDVERELGIPVVSEIPERRK